MSQSDRPEQKTLPHAWILALLLTGFLIVAVGYSVTIPAGEGVDETPHFDYVRYVKERHALPVQPVTPAEGVEVWMGHHPPLYYALGALVISWSDTSDMAEVFKPNPHFSWAENDGRNGWNVMLHFGQEAFPWSGSILALHALRFFNIFLALVTLYAIYRSGQLFFPEHWWAPLGITAIVAFNPSFIYMSSTIHHDVLQTTIFALAMWWSLRLLNKPERAYDPLLGGALVGAAMLTKLSGLTLALLIGLVLLVKFWQDRDRRSFGRRLAIVYGLAALIAGWWYVRNWLLYGDFLGWQMFLNIHSHMVRPTPYTWQLFTGEFLSQISRTFWGGFGFMHITFPEITRYLWWLMGLALVGFVIAGVRGQLALRRRWAEWLIVSASLLLLFISFVRFSMTTLGAGHGRYLFPAAFGLGAIAINGLNGFNNWRYQRLISVALALGMLVYAVWLPATRVLPKYDAPVSATEQQMARAERADLELAEGVQLVAYELGLDRALPGQQLPVSLYWLAQGDAAARQDPQVNLALVYEQGEELASVTTWPVPGLSPEVWAADTVYVTEASLSLPGEAGQRRLFLEVYPVFRSGSSDPNQTPDRKRIAEIITAGSVIEVDPVAAPGDRQEVVAEVLAFEGFNLQPENVTVGDTLLVDLYWRALSQPPADFTTFIHLLNEQGELVAQYDRPTGGAANPTSSWQAGQVLRDVYPLVIPEDLAPGRYLLRIGMYTWPSLERLPVTVDGALVGDSIEIGQLRIGP